jgi:hypothetical protein
VECRWDNLQFGVNVATQEQLSAPPAIKRPEPFIDDVMRTCLDEKTEDGFVQVICAFV